MKDLFFVLIALAMACAMPPAAFADTLDYAFSITGSGITGSGVLTLATTSTPGTDQITGISGTFSDANGGYEGQITGLYPDPTYAPIITTSYLFSTDNLLYPSGSPEVCFWGTCGSGGELDVAGMVFDVAATNGGTYEVGIWGDGGNSYGLDSDINGVYQDGGNNGVPVSFSAVATPEPSSLLLLGTGLLLCGLFTRKTAQDSRQGLPSS